MEFPIVVVDSLANYPRERNNEILRDIEEKYTFGKEFEPQQETKYYDSKESLDKAYQKKKITSYIVKEDEKYTVYSNTLTQRFWKYNLRQQVHLNR